MAQGMPSVCRAVLSQETVKAYGHWVCGAAQNPQTLSSVVYGVQRLYSDGPDRNENRLGIPSRLRKEISLGAKAQFQGLLLW